jgi:ribosome biogenesis protein NSA2
MVNKATFVGEGFTRKPVKLPILSVKKNPQSPLYTSLGMYTLLQYSDGMADKTGVLTKGSIIEVNVSELGLVTTSGKVVWSKYAQVTNNPENDGCLNSVLLV